VGLTMARDLPLLDLRGGPREQGLQHGTAARERIASNVSLYQQRFREWSGVSQEEINRRAEAYRSVIERASPDYAAAMEGIAAGSGQELVDIVALNVRYEILYSEFARVGMRHLPAPPSSGGCTSFAIRPNGAANGHLLIGQNWDWLPEVQGAVVRSRLGGLAQLAFTEAGIAGAKIGLNAAGLGLAINGLVSDRDSWSHLREPFHVRCWKILASRTIDDATASIVKADRSCSANFLVAQAGAADRVIDIEAAPERVGELAPRDGFLAHTNHFSDPEALGISQPLADERLSTYHRLERATTLLRSYASRGDVSIDDLKQMLRDHEGGTLAICRHEDATRAAHDRSATVVSVIMDLDDRVMFLASGTPCTSRYRRFELAA
jgi:isopenicillin-N N-acyltransferase like protein